MPVSQTEFKTINVPDDWTAIDILTCEDTVYLNDIAPRLSLEPQVMLAKAREKAGGDLWEQLGIKKLWTRWVVYMPRFQSFYYEHFFVQTGQSSK